MSDVALILSVFAAGLFAGGVIAIVRNALDVVTDD